MRNRREWSIFLSTLLTAILLGMWIWRNFGFILGVLAILLGLIIALLLAGAINNFAQIRWG